MLIVGERINSTRKSIAEAIQAKDSRHIQQEALAQAEAGCDFIDVNAGAFPNEEEPVIFSAEVVLQLSIGQLVVQRPVY